MVVHPPLLHVVAFGLADGSGVGWIPPSGGFLHCRLKHRPLLAERMQSNSPKDYLKRYQSKTEDEKKSKKKKEQKQKSQPKPSGLLVVDEDPTWQKPVDLGEENDEKSSDEEKPIVDEDIEVKRMKRLEQLRAISQDGSGWISLSDLQDISPPRGRRHDSPMKDTWHPQGNGRRMLQEGVWLFKTMNPSISGRGAEPVYRDKVKGVRISKEEYVKSKQKVEEKPKEKEIEWGKGLAQKREAEARMKELETEKDKPFARSRDDPELDNMLKDRLRWGDPMAHLVKKKYPEPVLPDLGEGEKMKESGFVVPQDIPDHSWLKRGLDAAPNRYGIRPGRHWNGVDRSR
ncbi:hypothetical protein Ahy_A10g047142 [Arachis hypogaea]|uniref:Uncharacterized protein n=1 Tax=Arachis hypogaea TaxID=3818 RepID=A0A445B1S4_ARAHY|nr:hypothetical protein Ahy_A10g047142 [Arachis hypogaea]